MDKKVTGVVAYLGIIGWLIAYLAGDKAGAKFHLNQSLVLAIAEVALGVLRAILGFLKIPVISTLISLVLGVVGLLLFVFAILGIISAAKGEDKPLPLIGSIQILM